MVDFIASGAEIGVEGLGQVMLGVVVDFVRDVVFAFGSQVLAILGHGFELV